MLGLFLLGVLLVQVQAEQVRAGGNSTGHLRRLEADASPKAPLAHYPAPFEDVDVDGAAPDKVSVDMLPWAAAIKETQNVLSLIHGRYELGTGLGQSFLLSSQNMATTTFDMIMYKFAKLLVDPDPSTREYLMIFGGSSVTAGHDNYYSDSYPLVVRAHLLPIMNMLGIGFHARNIAQGANDCMPYTYCYEAMGGENPDWVGWEQSYNCGGDHGVFELLGRIAGQSKNHAVVYYSASGAFKPEKCGESTTKPAYSSKEWTLEKAGITAWDPTNEDVAQWRKHMSTYHKAGASSRRFDAYTEGTNNYKGLGTYGFNVWMGNPKCAAYDINGTVTKTGCNGADVGMTCAEDTVKKGLKFMTWEAAEYGAGKGANWHPTRGFHMLRGEAITFGHGLALLGAMHHVKAELDKGAKPAELLDAFSAKLEEMHSPIQAVRGCGQYHCKDKPTCYSSYYPHYSPEHTLQAAIVGKTGWKYSGALMGGEFHTKWGYRDSRPSFEYKSEWTKSIAETDVYKDIHLKVVVTTTPTATLCGQLTDAVYYLHVDGQKDVVQKGNAGLSEYTPPRVMQTYPHTPTLKEMLNMGCIHLDNLPTGNHVVTIRANASAGSKVHLKLTHLVFWDANFVPSDARSRGGQKDVMKEAQRAGNAAVGHSNLFPERDPDDI